jgi:hypothetical protein
VKELGVANVREDAEGFDDLEEFFSQEIENNTEKANKPAMAEIQSQPLKQSPIRAEGNPFSFLNYI